MNLAQLPDLDGESVVCASGLCWLAKLLVQYFYRAVPCPEVCTDVLCLYRERLRYIQGQGKLTPCEKHSQQWTFSEWKQSTLLGIGLEINQDKPIYTNSILGYLGYPDEDPFPVVNHYLSVKSTGEHCQIQNITGKWMHISSTLNRVWETLHQEKPWQSNQSLLLVKNP